MKCTGMLVKVRRQKKEGRCLGRNDFIQIHISTLHCNKLPTRRLMPWSDNSIFCSFVRFGDHRVMNCCRDLAERHHQSYLAVFHNFYIGDREGSAGDHLLCSTRPNQLQMYLYVNKGLWMRVNLEHSASLGSEGRLCLFSFPVARKSVSMWVRSINLGHIYTWYAHVICIWIMTTGPRSFHSHLVLMSILLISILPALWLNLNTQSRQAEAGGPRSKEAIDHLQMCSGPPNHIPVTMCSACNLHLH